MLKIENFFFLEESIFSLSFTRVLEMAGGDGGRMESGKSPTLVSSSKIERVKVFFYSLDSLSVVNFVCVIGVRTV